MGYISSKASRGHLDRIVATKDFAHVSRATANPLLGGGQLALGRLSCERLVLEVERHDSLGPVLPDAARVCTFVVEDSGDAVVKGVDGLLLLVEVAGPVGLAVDIVTFPRLDPNLNIAKYEEAYPLGPFRRLAS